MFSGYMVVVAAPLTVDVKMYRLQFWPAHSGSTRSGIRSPLKSQLKWLVLQIMIDHLLRYDGQSSVTRS